MSKLYFSPVDKAFVLGSSQIKDTQEEINKLTKLILESNTQTAKKKPTKDPEPVDDKQYMRIGYPDRQASVFRPNTPEDSIDYNLMKVIGHPRFDEIVKNYALINHPEWLLRETVYVPSGPSKSTFGAQYSTTVCSNVKNYIMFYIISVVLFVLLSIFLKSG
jgi:hypothetical protein